MSQIVLSGIGNLAENVSLEASPDLSVRADQVLIAIEAANINPADFLYAAGWYGIPPVVGHSLGNEGVGRVLEIGGAVDSSLLGRRVIVIPNGEQGTWADQIVTAATNVVPIPDSGEATQLAQVSVNPVTALVLLNSFGDLKPGDWVGQTIGNSAVGRYVIQLAKRAGYRTLSVVRSEKAADEVRAAGGDLAFVVGDDLGGRISSVLHGEQLSLVLEGEGGATVGELAQSLKSGGTVVVYSSATGASQALGIGDVIYREIQLKGWWILNWIHNTPRAELEATYNELAALIASGEISSPVDSTYAIADYKAALAQASSPDRNGKVLFVPASTEAR